MSFFLCCSIGITTPAGHFHRNDAIWWMEGGGWHCGIAESFAQAEFEDGGQTTFCVLKECERCSGGFALTSRVILVDMQTIDRVSPYVLNAGIVKALEPL